MSRDIYTAPGDEALCEYLRDRMINIGWIHPLFLPFFGAVRLVPVAADHTVVQTYGIDYFGNMYINRGFAATLNDEETEGVLCHEVLHPQLLHHERLGDREPKRWNRAADRAINQFLREVPIKLPSFALYPDAGQEKLTTEELYEVEPTTPTTTIKVRGPAGKGGGKGAPSGKSGDADDDDNAAPTAGCGIIPPQPEAPNYAEATADGDIETSVDAKGNVTITISESKLRELKEQWDKTAAQAKTLAVGEGKGDVFARLMDAPAARVDWTTVLRNGVGQAAAAADREDVTYMKRSRRSGISGPQFPGWHAFKPVMSVVIDASGSVHDDALKQAVAETAAIAIETDAQVFLVVHDDGVQWAGSIDGNVDKICAVISGRGGTTFDEAYARVAGEPTQFDGMVHLTDGGVYSWPQKPANVRDFTVALIGFASREQIPVDAYVVEVDAP